MATFTVLPFLKDKEIQSQVKLSNLLVEVMAVGFGLRRWASDLCS